MTNLFKICCVPCRYFPGFIFYLLLLSHCLSFRSYVYEEPSSNPFWFIVLVTVTTLLRLVSPFAICKLNIYLYFSLIFSWIAMFILTTSMISSYFTVECWEGGSPSIKWKEFVVQEMHTGDWGQSVTAQSCLPCSWRSGVCSQQPRVQVHVWEEHYPKGNSCAQRRKEPKQISPDIPSTHPTHRGGAAAWGRWSCWFKVERAPVSPTQDYNSGILFCFIF